MRTQLLTSGTSAWTYPEMVTRQAGLRQLLPAGECLRTRNEIEAGRSAARRSSQWIENFPVSQVRPGAAGNVSKDPIEKVYCLSKGFFRLKID